MMSDFFDYWLTPGTLWFKRITPTNHDQLFPKESIRIIIRKLANCNCQLQLPLLTATANYSPYLYRNDLITDLQLVHYIHS